MLERNRIYNNDCIEGLRLLDDKSVNCCVTSPPYWGLRDYGVAGQIGLGQTLPEYIDTMVQVFREVRRVLRDDGTLWLNMGDTYCSTAPGTPGDFIHIEGTKEATKRARNTFRPETPEGLKPKDLVGLPWRVAFALQADGWYLRSDIIWHKSNAMPESVQDRPTKAHEYIFLLSKSRQYYYDFEAIMESSITFDESIRDRNNSKLNNTPGRKRMCGLVHNQYKSKNKRDVWDVPLVKSGNIGRKYGEDRNRPGSHLGTSIPWEGYMRNKRDVWITSNNGFSGAHFATFPEQLIEPCILAGCPRGGASTRSIHGERNDRACRMEERARLYRV